jgi:hypothetical protein
MGTASVTLAGVMKIRVAGLAILAAGVILSACSSSPAPPFAVTITGGPTTADVSSYGALVTIQVNFKTVYATRSKRTKLPFTYKVTNQDAASVNVVASGLALNRAGDQSTFSLTCTISGGGQPTVTNNVHRADHISACRSPA